MVVRPRAPQPPQNAISSFNQQYEKAESDAESLRGKKKMDKEVSHPFPPIPSHSLFHLSFS